MKLAKVGGIAAALEIAAGAARLSLQRARGPGRDRRRGAHRTGDQRSGCQPILLTDSPPSASSRRRSAPARGSIEAGWRSATARASGSSSTRRRSPAASTSRQGPARRAPSSRFIDGASTGHAWTRPTPTPRSPRRWSRSWPAAGAARGVSPGSRSTPLALALWRQPAIEVTVMLDERSAGFFALGTALATGDPAAVLCTSGSAAANLHPAVVEADEAGVPLIVLTADRPPELRGIGAGQTIDQLKLYGDGGALVLRGRDPRSRRRRAAALPLGRLPRVRRGGRRPATGARSPQCPVAGAARAGAGRRRGHRDRPAGARGPRRAAAERGDSLGRRAAARDGRGALRADWRAAPWADRRRAPARPGAGGTACSPRGRHPIPDPGRADFATPPRIARPLAGDLGL